MQTQKALILITLASAACGGDTAGPGVDGPEVVQLAGFGGFVSNAAPLRASSPNVVRLNFTGGNADSVAWISAAPSSLTGTDVNVTNRRIGMHVNATIVSGGFDPVAIPAEAGDTLEIIVSGTDGAAVKSTAVVPRRRRPRVVRTSPSQGQIDVAVNASIVVVLSEPLAPTSIDTARIHLRQGGQTVTGTVSVSPTSPVTVTFTPDGDLALGLRYDLELDASVADPDGDAIEGIRSFSFTTVEATQAPSPAPAPDPNPQPSPAGGTPQVVAEPVEVNFGPSPAGSIMQVRLWNRGTGATAPLTLFVAGNAFSAAGCDGIVLEPNASCYADITLKEAPARAVASELQVSHSSGALVTVPLQAYSSPPLVATATGTFPAELMAGLVSDPLTVTVTNQGISPSAPLQTRIADCTFWFDGPCNPLGTTAAEVVVTNDQCDGIVLDAGASCTLDVAWAPKSMGYRFFAVYFDYPGLHGFGVGGTAMGLAASPSGVTFPPLTVGSSLAWTVAVTNYGNQPTGVLEVSAPDAPFSLFTGANDCSGRTLAPSASCSVWFEYRPTTAGSHQSVVHVSGTPGGIVGIGLAGTAP